MNRWHRFAAAVVLTIICAAGAVLPKEQSASVNASVAAGEAVLPGILEEANHAIRRMNLGRMNMAAALVRFEGERATVSMPVVRSTSVRRRAIASPMRNPARTISQTNGAVVSSTSSAASSRRSISGYQRP